MTDEQLVRYLDAADTRLAQREDSRYISMVEAVRLGTVIASNPKALTRWQQFRARRKPDGGSAGLTGLALEKFVAGLARTNPDLVGMRT